MHRDTGAVQTVIVEYGFIDSTKDDIIQIKRDWKELAESVVKAYCKYRGYKYTAPNEKPASVVPKPTVNQFQTEIDWAVKNGIFNGKDLKNPVTREQMVAMLYRTFNLMKG